VSRAIRFAAGEREALRLVVSGDAGGLSVKEKKALASLLAKMDAASAPVEQPAPGLGWVRFESIVKAELGKKFAPAHVNVPLTSARIRDAGMTEEDLVLVCRWIKKQTAPFFAVVGAARLIMMWPELLARARAADAGKVIDGRPQGGPLEIE
jgi:hypothetical protein